MEVQGRRRLHHRRVRDGRLGHEGGHAPPPGRRQRALLRVPGPVPPPGADQEVLRLRPLAHPHGRGEGGPGGDRGDRRGGQAQEGLGHQRSGRGRQQHGADLAEAQIRSNGRGVLQVLQGEVPRLGGPHVGDQDQRRGGGELQGDAVHPQGRPLQLLQQGVRARAAAVLLRSHDHGEVQGPAARLLQVRAIRRTCP